MFLLIWIASIFMPWGVQGMQPGRNRKQRNGRCAYDLRSDLSQTNFRSFQTLLRGLAHADIAT